MEYALSAEEAEILAHNGFDIFARHCRMRLVSDVSYVFRVGENGHKLKGREWENVRDRCRMIRNALGKSLDYGHVQTHEGDETTIAVRLVPERLQKPGNLCEALADYGTHLHSLPSVVKEIGADDPEARADHAAYTRLFVDRSPGDNPLDRIVGASGEFLFNGVMNSFQKHCNFPPEALQIGNRRLDDTMRLSMLHRLRWVSGRNVLFEERRSQHSPFWPKKEYDLLASSTANFMHRLFLFDATSSMNALQVKLEKEDDGGDGVLESAADRIWHDSSMLLTKIHAVFGHQWARAEELSPRETDDARGIDTTPGRFIVQLPLRSALIEIAANVLRDWGREHKAGDLERYDRRIADRTKRHVQPRTLAGTRELGKVRRT